MEMDMPIPKGRGFTPFPFGQCQVCGAEATGNHYGANTCEGCKGFFKRSLPVFRTFRCFFGNKCEVTPETRNRCKACRFRKCVEAGMALDAVKMGRIPKAVKEHAMEGTTSKSGFQHRATSRPVSSVSQVMSQNSHGTTSSSPSAASASSSDFSDFNGKDSYPIPGSMSNNSGSTQSDSSGFNSLNTVASTGLLHHAANKSRESVASPTVTFEHYRFHPYAQQRFKADRNGYQQSGSDVLHNGGSSGLLYSPSAARGDGAKLADSQIGQKVAASVNFSARRSSRATVIASFAGEDPSSAKRADWQTDGEAHSAHVVALADMAITGDFNENQPDMVASPDKLRAVMANRSTAVAVMNPSLRGAPHNGMPVVPVDVLVFSPSYVSEDKLPETAQSKLNTKKRPFIQDAQRGAASSTELPSVPTAEFFNQISRNPALKTAICENTFHTVASKNNEIYGLETRANEVFLKESLSMGHVSKETELLPQEMRDILKDRLITQVKRVVQLSESIPGFRSLNVTEQHSLLRTCILDVWMVHSARFLRDKQSYIFFLETRTHYGRRWMEMFLTDEFLETVFQMASKINALDLSFDELALLKSILIVRPDRLGLVNVEFITILHNHLLDSLKLAISSRRPVESGQLLDDLLELLRGWCILDVMQEKYVHPIDLSHFSQGPWKIAGETGSVASSEDGGSVPASPRLQDANVASQRISVES